MCVLNFLLCISNTDVIGQQLLKWSLSIFITLFLLSSYSVSRLRVIASNKLEVLRLANYSCPTLPRQLLDMALVFHS